MKTMARIVFICCLAACSAQKQETKPPPAPAAQVAPKDAAQPASPPAAEQPAAGPATPPTALVAGKELQKTPDTGAVTAAQASQAAASAVPQPPLMPEQAFRDEQPPPLAVQPHFEAPVPVQRKLKNGARVLIVENHQIPLVAVDVRFLHGVDADPGDRPGLAEFVADMADEGTKTRSAAQLAEEIENLAAHLSTGASLENAAVHLNCLTETLPQALALLADVVQNPAFRKEDVERVRVLKLTQLEQKKSSIAALAADESSRVLWGPDHPFGKPAGGTPESVGSIQPDELADYHRHFWVPNDAVISVSGDVRVAEVLKLLDKAFADWKRRPLPRLELPKPPKLAGRSIDALDKASATQSQVWVVGRLFRARDPDAIPLRVANMTLGGLFTSRLNMNLREKHGYSYGVGSRLSLLRNSGTFSASGGIIAKNTVPAVAEYESELTRFAEGDVTDAELASAKEALIRGLPSTLETNDAVSGALSNLVSLGLPLDYYRTVAGRIGKVSRADVRRVVARWIHPQAWPIVIVGPVGQSKEALESLKLGPVSVLPAPGTTAAKPAASAGSR